MWLLTAYNKKELPKALDGGQTLNQVHTTERSLPSVDFEDDSILPQDTRKVKNNADSPRASTTFDADGKAIIRFFSSSDASSLPHEMYHIFRREIAQTIQDPRASDRIKQNYALIEDFVGAKKLSTGSGQASQSKRSDNHIYHELEQVSDVPSDRATSGGNPWTVEMEEKFAKAGERYLFEGKAPTQELEGVFARLKQWFTEIYTSLDLADFPISNEMRKVFGEILTPNYEQSDLLFRKKVGELASYDSLENMDTSLEVFDSNISEFEAMQQSLESA